MTRYPGLRTREHNEYPARHKMQNHPPPATSTDLQGGAGKLRTTRETVS